jgi:hypothetical protein
VRSSRLARRTKVRGFRLAVGSRHSTTALLRAAFAPLPLPNSQTEAQIIRTFRHPALTGEFSCSPGCPTCAHRMAYAAGPPSRPQRDEVRGRLYGGFGKFKKFSGLQMEISKKLFTLKMSGNGLALARNASSWYSSSAPVKVVSPLFPFDLHLDSARRAWDLASMISRPECRPESERQVLVETAHQEK